ncbi:MAG: ester cyclase [cyanobacterium endosymbiont of Rhopalodia musculus]|uniref:ester cyclase n=1 Tax=cyanobacterium endosymbiont of Epithemia clementina EcSB TaxID=3034674 RepID=UPI002481923F|nr:ester cyclase [cyanobacterium endosymbiont of Epithemia clementina EcSB]WGT67023.1 ester cyclase [cyanobacterium endosymbiont of Epithemia clementina EcSB]
MDYDSDKLPIWVQDRDTVIANDEGVQWRNGERPDYSYTNQFLRVESQFNHPEGSLEAIVENLVRTFEMEASHKTNPEQWLSIVTDKFRMSSNGGQFYTAQKVSEQGTYNLFIDDGEKYSATEETFESSFELFHKAFPNGFLWELTEVLSGPPNITFKWRHWGTFNGPYKDHQPTGQTIEIVGLSIARVTDDLKILEVEHYFDNSTFLQKLTSGCPFNHGKEKG